MVTVSHRTEISFHLHWHRDSLSNSLLICCTLGQNLSASRLISEPLLAQTLSENFFVGVFNNAYALFRLVKFICGWDDKFLVGSPFSWPEECTPIEFFVSNFLQSPDLPGFELLVLQNSEKMPIQLLKTKDKVSS